MDEMDGYLWLVKDGKFNQSIIKAVIVIVIVHLCVINVVSISTGGVTDGGGLEGESSIRFC